MEKGETANELYLKLMQKEAFATMNYKTLAIQHQTDLKVLRELLICAWDGIPEDEIQKVLNNNNKDRALYLKKLRYRYCAKDQLKKMNADLQNTALLVETIQNKVISVEESVRSTQAGATRLGEMFVDKEPKDGAIAIPAQMQSEEQSIKVIPDASKDVRVGNVPDSGTDMNNKNYVRKRLSHRQKKDMAAYIMFLKDEGYTNEQIDYVLKCAEKGLTPVEIEKFIHPGLTIAMMEKLRLMHEKDKD